MTDQPFKLNEKEQQCLALAKDFIKSEIPSASFKKFGEWLNVPTASADALIANIAADKLRECVKNGDRTK